MKRWSSLGMNLCLFFLLFTCFLFRFIWIDSIPGINGDEAYGKVWLSKIFLLEDSSEFSWILPVGRPASLIGFYSQGLVEILNVFSIDLIRFGCLVSSVLFFLFHFFIIRKEFDSKTGLVLILFLMSIPSHMMHARMFWSLQNLMLVISLAVILSFQGKFFWPILLSLMAFDLHPTGIFSWPLVLMSYKAQSERKKIAFLGASVGVFFLMLLGFLFFSPLRDQWPFVAKFYHKSFSQLGSRFDFQYMSLFLERLGAILTGASSYAYFPGSENFTLKFIVPKILFFLFFSFGGFQGYFFLKKREKEDFNLFFFFLGILSSVLIFYFVAGEKYLRTPVERHGMWLVMPFYLYLAFSFLRFLAIVGKKAFFQPILLLISALWLSLFWKDYFVHIKNHNTKGRILRTAEIEPKRQAAEFIAEDSDLKKKVFVFTPDWWLYWPIKYHFLKEKNIYITIRNKPYNHRFPKDYKIPYFDPGRDEIYVLDYKKIGTLSIKNQGRYENLDLEYKKTIKGYGGLDIFYIYKARGKISMF